MPNLGKISPRCFVVSILIAEATLAFDLTTPLGVAGGIPYLAMVLCGLWAGSRNFTLLLAGAASLLTMAGFLASPEGGVLWVVLTNRLLALFAIWTTALVITNRIREAERSKSKEQALAEAQRMANIGSWDWDIAADTLVWSDEVYRIFGLQPQQFGATYEAFLEYIHPDDRESVESAVQRTLQDGEPYEVEHRVVRADGSIRIVVERGEALYGFQRQTPCHAGNSAGYNREKRRIGAAG